MLDQSRDASLIGGGELTALPHGVDIEAMRTGGLAGMFFGINGARFVTTRDAGRSRQAGIVAAVSPVLEQKLVAVRARDTDLDGPGRRRDSESGAGSRCRAAPDRRDMAR